MNIATLLLGVRRSAVACALGSIVLIVSACGAGTTTATTTTAGSTTTSVRKTTTTTLPPQTTIALYFVRGTYLDVAHRLVNISPNPRFEGVQALLAGPTLTEAAQGLSTDIAPGTTLRGLEIRAGVATINLSPEFSATATPQVEAARLAQIVYTLTGFANVGRVSIEVGKATLTSFAGVDLTNPVTRSQVTAALPAVLLEGPAIGDRVVGSLKVSGITSFNGTYEIQLVDASGRLLAGVTNTAVVGGTFSQAIPFTVAGPTTGTLTVFARATNSAEPPQTFSLTLPVAP